MDSRAELLIATDALLLLSALIYGVRFLKLGNWLLGLEWLVNAVSTANYLIFLVTQSNVSYNVVIFCDQFSRSVGMPVIATAGLMAATHRYKPSVISEVLMFAVGIVVALLFAFTDFAKTIRPYFLLVAWSLFSLYLAYFAKGLWAAGEKLQAINVLGVLVSSQLIACIYDFYHLPGDDEQHSIFYIFALPVWTYAIVGLFYGYCALERAKQNISRTVSNFGDGATGMG